jgi:S-formylglutathione hydrolase FrmB
MRLIRIFRPLLALLVTGLLVAGSFTVPAVAAAQPAVRADDGARVVAQTWVDSRTLDLTVDSPALGTTAKARLLVPAGWTAGTHRSWPVLYLLHGCCDSYLSWTRSTDVASFTAKTPALVVMPEAGPVGFYSNWWNYGRDGAPAWETFHLTELRQLLERGYGAGQRRAIAGLSMGGFGALSYAARHPGMFRAAASYSGVIDTRYVDDKIDSPQFILQLVGGSAPDPYALWGDPQKQAAIWATHNPYDLLPLLRFTPIFVSCGNGQPGPYEPPNASADPLEGGLYQENVAFVARAKALRIPLATDLYGPGIHNWPYWERELHRSYPMLTKALGV